jgi:hypothetical protein
LVGCLVGRLVMCRFVWLKGWFVGWLSALVGRFGRLVA